MSGLMAVSYKWMRAVGAVPFNHDSMTATERPNPTAGPAPCEPLDCQPVVVVDNSEPIRYALKELLTSAGYHVTAVPNGQACLELVVRTEIRVRYPKLFVIDLMIDGMNGFELIPEIGRRCPGVPVLAISGGSPNVAPDLPLELAYRMGAAATLRKPFGNAEFLACVRRLSGEPDGER